MTDGAARVAAVLLHELADGQPFRGGLVLRQAWHVFRRPGQLFAQQHFGYPGATEYRAGPRRAGLLGQRRGQAEDAAAPVFANAIHALPLRTDNTWYAVMPGERFVEERIVGVEYAQH